MIIRKLKKILIVLILIFTSQFLFSQSGTAVVVYAEGEGFTLVREGVSNFYEVDYGDVLGMLLYPGDTILTEEDTFIEVQVTSTASLIKIAENTTFQFESIGNHGGGVLKVAYGRIRAKINILTNDDQFRISGTDTVAGVRGTDFGFDLSFGNDLSSAESNEAITTVYCFEGSVQVLQENPQTKEVKEVIISADQMIVTSSVKKEAPLLVYDIEKEIDQFWEENRFVYELAEEPVLVVSEDYNSDNYYTDKVFGEKRKFQNRGNLMVVSSMVFVIGGLTSYNLMEEKDLGVGLLAMGGASFLAGTIFLLQSASLPDSPEVLPQSSIE
jgi:hypothetical protein